MSYDDRVDAVTVESMREAARKYFDEKRYVRGVLYPEEAATPAAAETKEAAEVN